MKPSCPKRDASHWRAVELGQRDHAIDVQPPVAWVDDHLAHLGNFGVGGVDRPDFRPLEELADATARARPEDRQRAVLRGDDSHLKLHLHVIGAPGGHQRELIQRQRPRHPAGRDEHEALDVAGLDVLDDAVQDLVHVRGVDRDRVLVARVSFRSERQHQRVVLQLLLVLGVVANG